MGARVYTLCNYCNDEHIYIIGLVGEIFIIDQFLRIWKTKQKNFFQRENFDNDFVSFIKENKVFDGVSESEIQTQLDVVYKFVNGFFNPREKELLTKNILLSHQVEITPVVNSDLEESKREVTNIPILKLEFLNEKPYIREYSKNVLYLQYNETLKAFICPRSLQFNAVVTRNEED
ncbi:hypothetical protein [Mycoplasmopsis gallinacea]|uniref:Uncharacterized protein n=1 Tax=Mycoplasmopsis gallinacea TaxID=29556 RepID=A0A6H0V4Z5_9BACT|nr:hypothetical protein [Mycoplasmopsis gallinacea]QIW62097.1 hypothetical protein GOQ20_01325 [Mycoplasmopsis gallinacea]